MKKPRQFWLVGKLSFCPNYFFSKKLERRARILSILKKFRDKIAILSLVENLQLSVKKVQLLATFFLNPRNCSTCCIKCEHKVFNTIRLDTS